MFESKGNPIHKHIKLKIAAKKLMLYFWAFKFKTTININGFQVWFSVIISAKLEEAIYV